MKRGRKPKSEVSPEIAAISRLSKEGASGNAAIRKRIALIAAERKLDPSETKALMTGRRLPHHPLCQFAKKHHLSFDWLLCGDLKGRLRMARNEIGSQQPVLDPWYEVVLLLKSWTIKDCCLQRRIACASFLSGTVPHHETAPKIPQEAELATVSRSLETAEAITSADGNT
jgi:hypothetical protein